MSGLQYYYYYCPETDAYELDGIPPKSPSSSEYSGQVHISPYASYPSSPSSDRDSFFGSSCSDLSLYSSAGYRQNASTSAIANPSEFEDAWTAAPSRASESLDNLHSRSSPFYDRQLSEGYSGQSHLLPQSANRPEHSERVKSLPNPFSPPLSPRVTKDTNLTQLTNDSRPRLFKAPACPSYGRHVTGACTCPPDVVYHDNHRGYPTPRCSPPLQIDADHSLNHVRLGSKVAPVNSAPWPCQSPFPTASSSRPYLNSEVSSSPKGTRDNGTSSRLYSKDSEPRVTSCYQGTPGSTRRPIARIPGPRKLTKRRVIQRPPERAISFPSVSPDLFPQPLSTTDIAIAKLTPVLVPPLTLDEFLTSSKKRGRLSLKELADREEMADMLRSVRPVSLPLKQSPPLKRYKTRRINFLSSISPPSTSYSDPGIQRASTNTEALASLAWNGVVPSASASSSTFEPSEESLYFSERDAHPPNMKTNRPRHGPEPNRRWTFAMAMADEDVTDEVLVEQLERMRSGASLQGGMDHPFHSSLVWMQHSSRHGDSPPARSFSSPNVHDGFLHPHVLPRSQTTDFEDATAWPTARKALLCCREIVRTEKRYMDELKALINGETTTPPPALMLEYLPALLRASKTLLRGFTEDPSAWGVSTTFMGCEEELEAAMVAWSGVAGQFFAKKDKSKSWKRPRTRTGSHTLASVPSSPTSAVPPVPSLKSGDSTITALPPKLVLMADKLKEKKTEADEREKTSDKAEADDEKNRRKLSVRDLAIQPTQRVMRYALLYRDLLAHTPRSSPSHALVESALEAAQRIAQRCDSAQNNAAFLPALPTSSSNVASQSDSSKNTSRSFMSVIPTRQES